MTFVRSISLCLSTVLTVGLLFGTSACKHKRKKPVTEKVQKKYYIKGNPMKIIEGAQLNREMLITTENMHQFDGFFFTGEYSFERETEQATKQMTKEELKDQNKPREVNEAKPSLIFSFKQLSANRVSYTANLPKGEVSFVFSVEGTKLHLLGATNGTELLPLELLHSSVHSDGNAFSLLFHYPKDNSISIVQFNKPNTHPFMKAPKAYPYLLGGGVKVHWAKDKPLTVNVCGREAQKRNDLIFESLAEWQRALGKKINIDLRVPESYPPFSDLNSNCIYWINDYLSAGSDSVAEMGVTFAQFDLVAQNIVAANILIFDKEIEKLARARPLPQAVLAYSLRVIKHELGHLLGLDHPFGNYQTNRQSIMDYEQIFDVTEYDTEMINALYE